ncbi:MAG: chorismate synthase [Clostridia bacterium]|nr:chorismate synthase [Clostridia bacterium]
MNTFGQKIKVTVFGQSHATAIGVVVDGLEANFPIDEQKLQSFVDRRAPGKNAFSTSRKEADKVKIVSGLYNGKTCGAPICAIIENGDQHSKDYSELEAKMRPSHADYPANVKFDGNFDVRGGGQFSGRLTAPICVAGAIIMQMLEQKGVYIGAHILSIGEIEDDRFDNMCNSCDYIKTASDKDFPVLNDKKGEMMKEKILEAKNNLDSVGGSIECMITGLEAGIGEPMFDGLENVIAHSVFAIPAVKGIEFGAGFEVSKRYGSQNNDEYTYDENGRVRTLSNNAGGICAGMSTSMPINFDVCIKPTPSIARCQKTVNIKTGKNDVLEIKGRHDPCIVQRAVPCIEAAAAIAIAQFLL